MGTGEDRVRPVEGRPETIKPEDRTDVALQFVPEPVCAIIDM